MLHNHHSTDNDDHQNNNNNNNPAHIAALHGTVLAGSKNVNVHHRMLSNTLLLGRSDPAAPEQPLKPLNPQAHLGLGLSTKLSRLHARIDYHPPSRSFTLTCLGRNPVLLTPAPRAKQIRVADKQAHPLPHGAAINIASSRLRFFITHPHQTHPANALPAPTTPNSHSSPSPPPPKPASPSPPPKKRKRREWIKSEHHSLRALMMRYGYGRWRKILSETNSRLSERQPEELIPVARNFVARCYLHARPGVEQKALMDILKKHPTQLYNSDERAIQDDVDLLLHNAREQIEPNEKRKFVRWARKLRLLSRLHDVHHHHSLHRLRARKLRVFTPPPALYWTSDDDADLIIGSYKHGYGAIESIRLDPELGFYGRYAPALSTKKTATPVKTENLTTGANADPAHMEVDDDDDDDENDHDPDKDEDDRHALSLNDDVDDENMHETHVHNPKKRPKLGHTQPPPSFKHDINPQLIGPSTATTAAHHSSANTPHSHDESDMSPVEPNPVDSVAVAVQSHLSTQENGDHVNKDVPKEEALSDVEKTTTKRKRFVPKRGPRIGNDDGFNNPEEAAAAAKAMADQNGLVPFPNSEALMKRLKSTINSCAKEFDRDMKKLKKKQMAESKAKQRRDDLAARKAEKEAEKTRRRVEKRIKKSQPFSKKEALEFERALANFGVVYKEDNKVDWTWFHSKVEGFEAKYHETLDAAYVELLSEAHLITSLSAAKEDEDFEAVENLNKRKKPSTVFSTLTPERAEKLIERMEFFRALRGEILVHQRLKSILRGLKKTRDLPPWWKSLDDRSLLIGVDRYGFNGWDNMSTDPDLTFAYSMKSWQRKMAGDSKSMKRAVMPKPSAGIKRANALLRYFRSRANDPHFEYYVGGAGAAGAAGPSTAGAHAGSGRLPPSSSDVLAANDQAQVTEGKFQGKDEELPEDDKPLMQLVRNREAAKNRSDASATQQHATSGRPRTLRQTIIRISKDEDGILILPANLGDGLFLLSLGDIVQGAPAFCKSGVVYPVGFRTIRCMSGAAFLCEILSDQDRTRPEFRISVLDGFNDKAPDEDTMWTGQREIGTSRNVVTLWVRVMNEELSKDQQTDNKVFLTSGPERFGLYEPTIVYHIQKLPGAKFIDGFVLRDFSIRGKGQYVEPSAGILDAMLNALDPKLDRRLSRRAYDVTLTDEEEDPREHPVLAAEAEMSIPDSWKATLHDSKRKQRRRSNSYF